MAHWRLIAMFNRATKKKKVKTKEPKYILITTLAHKRSTDTDFGGSPYNCHFCLSSASNHPAPMSTQAKCHLSYYTGPTVRIFMVSRFGSILFVWFWFFRGYVCCSCCSIAEMIFEWFIWKFRNKKYCFFYFKGSSLKKNRDRVWI